MSGKPTLAGQTVVVIGGSSGIGLETARLARDEGAQLILAARDADRLSRVGRELGASTVAFDATDFAQLKRFFDELSATIDHVLVTAPARTMRRWRSSTSRKHAATSRLISCCRCRSLVTLQTRFVPEGLCSSWAAPVAGVRGWDSRSSRRSRPRLVP